MLRAPLSLFKKAAGWLAPEKASMPAVADEPAVAITESEDEITDMVEAWPEAVAETPSEVQTLLPSPLQGKIDVELVGKYAATERFSIITAVYNVGRYLDDFLTSIVNQSADFWSCIEVILVDDGSTDDSAELCRSWVERYPVNIRYFRQENAGQGQARNHGLRYARNDWVTFIDPDDFISQDYFEQIDRAVVSAAGSGKELRLVTPNLVFYRENTGKFEDSHPLRYRFAKGNSIVPASNPGKHIILSASCSVFYRRLIINERLTFDSRIKPAFEDAHFVNRYLVSLGDAHIAFLSAPKYYYRKRGDGTSTLDTGWLHPGRYGDQLRYGSLGLIDYCLKRVGSVPVFIQRTLMYDLAWQIKYLINSEPPAGILTEEGLQEYRGLLQAIMDHISEEVILGFELAGVWFYHKVGILSVFKEAAPNLKIAYCGQFDDVKCMLELKHYSAEEICTADIKINGRRVVPVYSKTRCHWLLGAPFVHEHSLWVEVGDGNLTITLSGQPARVSVAGKQHSSGVPLHSIVAALRRKPISEKGLPDTVIALRRAAREPIVMRKYGGCWLLMDRDTQADDNAEHFYRYLSQEHPEIRAFFVLRSDSPDWARLEADGFRLLDFGTEEHQLALLNADHLVSSHADQFIFGELGQTYYGDLLRYKYTFLQHGITKDDLSRWLNQKGIACFVTATKPEYDSIAEGVNYKFSAKDVALTGFPRHDRLLALRGEPEKVILVMPTWRNSLVGPSLGQGNARALNPEFHDSIYARSWGSLLRSRELHRLVQEHGYKVVFFPHPNVVPYIEGFALPEHVEVRTQGGATSIQQVFAQAAILITDYSSVAFEMAYIDRPVIYFQFDRDTIFAGDHTYQKGYFEYERDGFGPVCSTESEVVRNLANTLNAGCAPAPEYQARIDRTFALRDGQCCRRTFEAIHALDVAVIPEQTRLEALLAFARRTSAFEEWKDAYAAWQQLRGSEGTQEREVVLNLAVSARMLGKIDECRTYLAEAKELGVKPSELLKEHAAVAVAVGEFDQAIVYFEQWSIANDIKAVDAQFVADMVCAYRRTANIEEAERLLAMAADVVHPKIEWERAELASLKECWEEAVQRWTALSSSADKFEVALKLTEALLNVERIDEAQQALAKLPWENVPTNIMRRRAELAYRLLDWKSAVKAWMLLESTAELEPNEWLKLAKACRKRGDLDQAARALNEAQESSDVRTLLQERALLLSAQAQWAEAVEAWKIFLERRDLAPNRDAWLYLARAQMNMGELEGALRTVRRFARARGHTEESSALQSEIERAMAQSSQTASNPDGSENTLRPFSQEHDAQHEGVSAEALV